MSFESEDAIRQLNANIVGLSRNIGRLGREQKQRTRKGSKGYGTTRLTTPDVGGFRAFFNAAIGDAFIDAVEEKGFKAALTEGFDKITGRQARRDIQQEFQNTLDQLQQRLQDDPSFTKGMFEEGVAGAATRRDRRLGAQTLKTMRNFALGLGVATFALLKFRDSLLEAGRNLGGVSMDDAFRNQINSFFTSFKTLLSGQLVRSREIQAVQGGISQEFGTLISTDEAARLAQIQQRLGISTQELVKLQRALQGTGMEAESAVNEFREVGIVGRVAATEIAKNADAVARAGNRFNDFIVQGVKNARRLGLEFGQIEQRLTGISTDFTGTVTSFAELRSVIPGFATDFGQLFSTALYGSTDDFIEQIRGTLQGAGVNDVSQLNRTQLALLEQATGFGAAEIQRILDNEEVFQDSALDLDTKRNAYLNQMNVLLGTLIGVTAGGFLMSGFGPIGSLIGMFAGGALGAGAGYATGRMFNDFVFRPGQPPVKFSPQDTLVGVKKPEQLGGPGTVINDFTALENKVDQLIITMRDQTEVMRTGMSLEVKGMDKAIAKKREAVIRSL